MEILARELNLTVPAPDTPLLEAGLLDSLGVVDLVYRLEQRFGIAIPFDTLEPKDFRSVEALTTLVVTGLARSAPDGRAPAP